MSLGSFRHQDHMNLPLLCISTVWTHVNHGNLLGTGPKVVGPVCQHAVGHLLPLLSGGSVIMKKQ